MITERNFLICTCDSCGKLLFDDESNCVFDDMDAVNMAIRAEKWDQIKGSRLCYSCYLNKIVKL